MASTPQAVGLSGRIVFARAGGSFGEDTLFTATANGDDEQRLLSDEASAALPRFSPDGKRLLLVALDNNGDFAGTATVNLDGTGYRAIPNTAGQLRLAGGAWSPDGKQIAFQGWDDDDSSRAGVYVGRAEDASSLIRVTQAEIADIPADWSPDGGHLLVFREGSVKSVGVLDVVSIDGSGRQQLTPDGLAIGFGQASFSPDGERIVFNEARTSSTGALYVIRPDGTDLVKVFEDTYGRFASHPTWSPDGSMILFSLNPIADEFQHPPNGLYVIAADGTDLRIVIDSPDFKREAQWWYP